MDIKYINPFMDSLIKVLNSFGIIDVKRGKISRKDTMNTDKDVTSIIGIVGGFRGNVAYSFSSGTAKLLASSMMMGMPVAELDSMSRSAVGELTNMITGTAAGIFSANGEEIQLTPPSLIFGDDIFFIISMVQTISIDMLTPAGVIEINIGLEV
jgi:chemotaxis protein CheX